MNDNYIVIKELPDASVGTKVIWEDGKNVYSYEKSSYVSPYDVNVLTDGQVTQNPEYFTKEKNYPEYYAFHNPVYNRNEILDLIKEYFPGRNIDGCFNSTASNHIYRFETKLKNLGVINAKKILEK